VATGLGAKPPPESYDTFFVKICYFELVLRCKHMNQFNMKWKKNQFGSRKVVGKATVLAHWAKNVGGLLPLPISFCCQCVQK